MKDKQAIKFEKHLNGIAIRGITSDMSPLLKGMGGKWDPSTRAWVVPEIMLPAVQRVFDQHAQRKQQEQVWDQFAWTLAIGPQMRGLSQPPRMMFYALNAVDVLFDHKRQAITASIRCGKNKQATSTWDDYDPYSIEGTHWESIFKLPMYPTFKQNLAAIQERCRNNFSVVQNIVLLDERHPTNPLPVMWRSEGDNIIIADTGNAIQPPPSFYYASRQKTSPQLRVFAR